MKRKGKGRGLTMKQRILYSVLIAVAVTVVILSAVNRMFLHSTSMKTALYNYSEINRLTGKYLDEAIHNAETGINRMVFEGNFQQSLLSYEQGKGQLQEEELKYNVKEVLASSLVISDLYGGIISNVIVFDVDGRYIASMRDYNQDADISSSRWKKAAEDLKGKSLWVETHRDSDDTYLQHADVISVAKMLYSTELSYGNNMYGKCIGYVLVNIKEQDFARLYSDVAYGNSGTLRIVDEENMILSSGNKEEIGTAIDGRLLCDAQSAVPKRVDGKRLVLSNYYNRSTGWRLVGNVEESELTIAVSSQWMNFAVIAVVVFVLILLIMVYVSKRITEPLAALQKEMKRVEGGDFSVRLENSSILEINDLINGFQVMVCRLDELMEHVYESGKREQELQLMVTEARLSILQNQMNPHFLYNTLDSIGWMAALSGQQGISQMVNSLGEILRASVKMDTFISTVDVELELLQKYLYIQKVRHGEKLKVSIKAEESLMKCRFLKFMLQPFVENAIVHGLRETGEQLSIEIRIYGTGDMLVSEVRDDGRGMEAAVRERLFMEKEAEGKHTGTGCCNVYKRLQLVYKDRFQCRAESEPEKGTGIIIKIPLLIEIEQ